MEFKSELIMATVLIEIQVKSTTYYAHFNIEEITNPC